MTSVGKILHPFEATDEDIEGDGEGSIRLERDVLVLVDWEHTDGPWYRVKLRSQNGIKGAWVPKTHLKLCPVTPAEMSDPLLGCVKLDGIEQYDAAVGAPDGAAADGDGDDSSSSSMATSPPPPLSGSLASFVHPLTEDQFRAQFFDRHRVFASHHDASRCSQLLAGLPNNDNWPGLVDSARSIYVWMSTPDGVAHHFAVVDRTVAKRVLASGGSLYLSPDTSLDRSVLQPLARALYGPFAVSRSSAEQLGGDVELFATTSRHVTPWHFDGQSGFNVQLTGTKLWQLVPGACVKDCVTNMSNTSDTKQRRVQRALHRVYSESTSGSPGTAVKLPGDLVNEAVTVLMRPGSVLFVPRGTFHRVVCDDNDGALSLNFSFSAIKSYADLLLPAVSLLLQRSRAWRQPLGPTAEQASQHLSHLVESLPSILSHLSNSNLLMPPIMLKQCSDSSTLNTEEVDDDNHNDNNHNDNNNNDNDETNCFHLDISQVDLCPVQKSFRLNVLAALTCDPVDEPTYGTSDSDNFAVCGGLSLFSSRQCGTCGGDAGLLGSFCRFCGAKLVSKDRKTSSKNGGKDSKDSNNNGNQQQQSQGSNDDDNNDNEPEDWYVVVCPPVELGDEPLAYTKLLVSEQEHKQILKSFLSLNQQQLVSTDHPVIFHSTKPSPASISIDNWRRCLQALFLSGFLIEAQSTFDPQK